MNTTETRIDQLASESMLDAINRSNMAPAVAASLRAEIVDSQEEADSRIQEELTELEARGRF